MNDHELRSAGLYEPGVDDPKKAALIRRCLEIGLTVEEIREAGDDLIDRAVQRVLGSGDERFTMTDVADRADIPLSRIEKISAASAIAGAGAGPDDRIFDERDVVMMSTIGLAFDLLGEDAVLQLIRVATAAVVRLGDASMSTFLTSVGAAASRDDESGLQLLEANIAAMELLPLFGDTLAHMLLRYMRQAYRPRSESSLTSALAEGLDTRKLAVGFADLVGSTTLTDNRSLADLSAALDAFEQAATDTITTGGGRVVKFIGDEVMFRADTADAACAMAIDLVKFLRTDPLLPPLRVGIAFGDVLSREGDFYGSTVNLAARVTKLAPLHGVVTTIATIDALHDQTHFEVHPLGAIEMQGLSKPVELASLSPRSAQHADQ